MVAKEYPKNLTNPTFSGFVIKFILKNGATFAYSP
jgi:hypothetical protein